MAQGNDVDWFFRYLEHRRSVKELKESYKQALLDIERLKDERTDLNAKINELKIETSLLDQEIENRQEEIRLRTFEFEEYRTKRNEEINELKSDKNNVSVAALSLYEIANAFQNKIEKIGDNTLHAEDLNSLEQIFSELGVFLMKLGITKEEIAGIATPEAKNTYEFLAIKKFFMREKRKVEQSNYSGDEKQDLLDAIDEQYEREMRLWDKRYP